MVDGYFPEKQDGQPGVLGARENSGRVAIGAGVDALSALGAQWGSIPEGVVDGPCALVPPTLLRFNFLILFSPDGLIRITDCTDSRQTPPGSPNRGGKGRSVVDADPLLTPPRGKVTIDGIRAKLVMHLKEVSVCPSPDQARFINLTRRRTSIDSDHHSSE